MRRCSSAPAAPSSPPAMAAAAMRGARKGSRSPNRAPVARNQPCPSLPMASERAEPHGACADEKQGAARPCEPALARAGGRCGGVVAVTRGRSQSRTGPPMSPTAAPVGMASPAPPPSTCTSPSAMDSSRAPISGARNRVWPGVRAPEMRAKAGAARPTKPMTPTWEITVAASHTASAIHRHAHGEQRDAEAARAAHRRD